MIHDPVNHPSHYTQGGIECIDAIDAAIGSHTDPVGAFLTGQVIKYCWRWPLKSKPLEDLKKARFYLDRLIGRLESKEPATPTTPSMYSILKADYEQRMERLNAIKPEE